MPLDIASLKKEIDTFKNGETEQSWRRAASVSFSNDYITVLRIDSSNKAGGSGVRRGKMWSIIIDIKRGFNSLPHWVELRTAYGRDLGLTLVTKGELIGNFGIRFYNMAKDPTDEIVLKILRFIFEK